MSLHNFDLVLGLEFTNFNFIKLGHNTKDQRLRTNVLVDYDLVIGTEEEGLDLSTIKLVIDDQGL